MPAPDYFAITRRARQLQSEAFWRIMGLLARFLGRAPRRIGKAVADLFRKWRAYDARRQAVAGLLAMDHRALRDLGLDRTAVYFAVDHGRENPPPAANANGGPSKASAA